MNGIFQRGGSSNFLTQTWLTRWVAGASVILLGLSMMNASQRVKSGEDKQQPQTQLVAEMCGSPITPANTDLRAVGELPDYQQIVSPADTQTRVLAWDGAKLEIKPRSVSLPVGIGITSLSKGRVPKLDSGMTNVTGKNRQGFRFTPTPFQFTQDVTITLPYDPELITDEFTAQDVYTYFFDEVRLCWQVLQRVSVDEVNHTVTSLTDHFTNMINATVMVPEHPEGAQFNPNQMKDLQAADPGSRVNLIAAPVMNSHGDNRLSYPIEVPAGRQSLQPQLAVGYSSASSNGWMGLGWDMASRSISVDVRWGVPRYEGGQETESYLFDGEQLTPLVHRGALVARTAEKVFNTRVEGEFAKIIRHGADPKAYSWEVIDKSGTHWFFGGAGATLADDAGNIFLWALREVRDANDNFMTYRYALVEDTGLASGSVLGRNLYPKQITYTGNGTVEGKYAVTFTRDRERNETLRVDKGIDARGGFKRVTADLLRQVDVTLDNSLIRRYRFDYTTGAFHKTLLRSITQYDSDGTEFNKHTFDYYDDIRDPLGQYQAFRPLPWTSPGDSLRQDAFNLTPEQAGNASAINANSSLGGGGHLYVGVGTSISKSNSVGVKVGFSHGEQTGVLALVDVDGDSLPDKVFRDGGIKYRKNLSKPGGQPRFSDEVHSLNLPNVAGESSNTLTLGVEAYFSAVAAQLDYVNTFSTASQYFSDVNGDGIGDLVNGSSVLFGRVGPNGVAVYGIAADTPVPVGFGQINTDGIVGNLNADRERMIDSFPLLDTVRRWVAPYDGTVKIEGAVKLADQTQAARAASQTADGVRIAIQHEATELFTDTIGAQDNTSHTPSGVDSVAVSRGDRIYFRVQSVNDGALDLVSWDPKISYLNVPDPLDVNGLPFFRYQASRDFTLGGRGGTLKAPLTGTMRLSGDFLKKAATTDDVTVQVLRDGTPVFQHTVAAAATQTVAVNLDVAVQKGQVMQWRIKVDSPIDVDQIEWAPRLHYTASTEVDRLFDGNGNPLVKAEPPYTLDLYPVDGLTGPQGFYVAPEDGVLTVDPALAFNFGSAQPNATIAFTVKKRGALLGKRFFTVEAGVLTSPGAFNVNVADGDELFFDFSVVDANLDANLQPTLRNFLTSRTVSVSLDGSAPQSVPSALHTNAAETAFPQPYRGWGAIGYNGNRAKATQPIVQTDLVVDEDFGDQIPDNVDPQAQKDAFKADPRINPPKVALFVPSPVTKRWYAGEHSFVTSDAASSSRMGIQTINLPRPEDFAGAGAVPRLSRTEQISLTGSVSGGPGSLGGSIATGTSTGQVDFIDMNGDQFPDVVSQGGIQYSDMVGGLGSKHGALPDGAVRRSESLAGNANAGSAARTIATGKGQSSPPGHTQANMADSGNDMPPLSAGGSIGGSESNGAFDLLDLNGDTLPDRVYADGRVALNIGYSFEDAESWRGPDALNAGSGSNFGLNIGFNTDFYGFAGGASYSEDSSEAHTTLMDVNGDGLLDRVKDTTPIRVALNTGNGFEAPVDFFGSLAGINGDQNTRLGGGVYFTFGFCFVAVCIVINPGGDISGSASRTEKALRDMDGDGFVDHIASKQDDQLTVAQNTTARTNLLKSVSQPLRGRMDFDYTRDGNTYDLPQSRWLLTRVAANDGHPGDGQDVQLTTYEYSGGVFDRLEREFYGYGTVIERHRDAGSGDAVYRNVIREFDTTSHYTKGLLRKERTTDAAGRPFLETENTYVLQLVGGGVADPKSTTATIFPQLARTDKRFFEGQAVAGKTTFATTQYDAIGNVIRSFDAADTGPADDMEAVIGYASCPATNILGAANSIVVRGNGVVMRQRESTVDCATGDIRQVRAFLAGGGAAVTDIDYFPNGNIKTVVNPPNDRAQRYRLDYTYETTVNTHVESITDSFGYRSTMTHNLKFGEVETTTDFNGQVVRNVYDPAGRIDTVAGPYEVPENRITIDYEYHPEAPTPYAVTRHIDRQADNSVRADTIDTITFIDGLKRNIQTKKDAAVHTGVGTAPDDVMMVTGRVIYDFLGRTIEQFYPITEAKGPANTTFNTDPDPVVLTPTRLSYDVQDRDTRTVIPDGTTTTTSYGFGPDRAGTTQFETVVTDGNGKVKRTYADVRDLTVAVKEFNPAGGQPVIWTSYAYDPLQQLTTVTDDRGNVTSAVFDNFGRRTIVDSPDSGRTETVYDLSDQVTRKITAKLRAENRFIAYEYDFNRVVTIRYPTFTANTVTYTYGAPGAPNNGANRIIGVVDGSGTVSREYGPLGELTKETRTSPAQGSHIQTFVTQYRYDTWNRMLRMTFPDGEVMSYRYNSGGQVDLATGVKGEFTYPYLTKLEYDKFEQRVLLETGNGTRTVYTYRDADRRLINLQASLDDGYVFHNLEYTYDPVGNVTQIRNNTVVPPGPEVGKQVGGPSTQTFRYDDIYRLTHAEGSYQSRNPHNDRYRLDLSYDTIHNITNKNQVHELVSDGNTIVENKLTYNYAYAYAGPRPHAPTTLGLFTLQYDQNGNQVSRDQQPRPRRQMIWDEENRLACSHENVQSQTLPQTPASCDNAGGTPNSARYFYDDQGNRVVKDGAQFHMYPNQNYSTRGNQEFKHIYIGETRILTKFVEPEHRIEDRQYYAHSDHLGSTGFVTDDQGDLSEHLGYMPAGETWVSEHPSMPVPQQFTGKEIDPETNLYYFGARYYDPRTQVWQTPDPILESYMDGMPGLGVYHSMNLALYSYARHNPVKLGDPDGKFANILIGAGVGALIGVGIEGIRQAASGEFNAGRLAGAAAAGAISGGVAGATMGASLVVQGAAAVGAGVAGGVASRAISGEAQSVEAMVTDGVVAGVTFGVIKGGGAIVRSVRGSPPPPAAPTGAAPRPAAPTPKGCSFDGATRVLLADGTTKPISQIQPGEQVMATDAEAGISSAQDVSAVWVHGDHLIRLKLDSGVLTTTEDHPYWNVTDGRWERADELDPDDSLLSADGETVTVRGILPGPARLDTAYNLTVDNVHTFYVIAGHISVLVHNTCGTGVKSGDIVPYRPTNPGLENHHGVLDAWAKNNIPGYISRHRTNTTIALTPAQHKATNTVIADFMRSAPRVGGKVDWKNISPREMQGLSERMFNAAGVSQAQRNAFYAEFNRYIYGLAQ